MSRRSDPFEEIKRILEQLQDMNDVEDMMPDDGEDGESPFGGQSPFGDSPFGGDNPFGDSPFGPDFDVDDFPFGDGGFDQDWGDFGPDGDGGGGIAVDVLETDEEFEVTADLPGFAKDDIDLTLADNTLHITASRENESEESNGSFVQRERFTESVSRVLELPEEVDDEGIDADFSNGVLTVTLPKIAGSGHEITIE